MISTTRPEREQVSTSTFCWLSTGTRCSPLGRSPAFCARGQSDHLSAFGWPARGIRRTQDPRTCPLQLDVLQRWAPRIFLNGGGSPGPSPGSVVQNGWGNNRCKYEIGSKAPALHKSARQPVQRLCTETLLKVPATRKM